MALTKLIEVYEGYFPEDIESDLPEYFIFQQSIIKAGDIFKSKNNKGEPYEGRICSHSHSITTEIIFKEQMDKYEYYE